MEYNRCLILRDIQGAAGDGGDPEREDRTRSPVTHHEDRPVSFVGCHRQLERDSSSGGIDRGREKVRWLDNDRRHIIHNDYRRILGRGLVGSGRRFTGVLSMHQRRRMDTENEEACEQNYQPDYNASWLAHSAVSSDVFIPAMRLGGEPVPAHVRMRQQKISRHARCPPIGWAKEMTPMCEHDYKTCATSTNSQNHLIMALDLGKCPEGSSSRYGATDNATRECGIRGEWTPAPRI
jgi:hypothetical protein